MKIWYFIEIQLQAGIPVMLICVADNHGSSPGRQGFKMAVSLEGKLYGTIGGGIMEHKMVEYAKSALGKDLDAIELRQQFHDKKSKKDRSGMICSGEQTLLLVPLYPKGLTALQEMLEKEIANPGSLRIRITPDGLSFETFHSPRTIVFEKAHSGNWLYTEPLVLKNRIHIFGGGHVGLALSEVMSLLDFEVILYDDRPVLNTREANIFALEKHTVDYEKLDISGIRSEDFVAILTFSYRSDKLILRQLHRKQVFYLGLMGSEEKIRVLFDELEAEGVSRKALQPVFAPIGLETFSKTPMEIAVSIAAQIIREKNKNLPTGRTLK